jgi:putative glycosyltransferase (TIGR04348 family)
VERSDIVIVTPALADANNGNWQTAHRWERILSRTHRVRLCQAWEGGSESLLIAMHARRSAHSVAAWRSTHADRPILLVLTGTDLYRDIARDDSARQSIRLADSLVVLNELGAQRLAPQDREKTTVILQSSSPRKALQRTDRHLRALMVGHLRAEKSPQTFFNAARRLVDRDDILLDHIGSALDPALGEQAQALMQQCPQYRWLGPLPHQAVRRRIQAAHLLVHPSRMEGGAHVVVEAVRSGTPVLASGIDGNIGLLGPDYSGYFPVGNDLALASLLESARDLPGMLAGLSAECDARAPLFEPARERAALQSLVASLIRRHS